ncbi:TonB-dependent receptor plug domain-containing protein [Beijerinckia indica]|uniref:TonB-dependent receptor plug domain-containing protein n=1 Tax=Beijerinckia indica TaxID=533 RepID=UPI001FCB0277|nr:TonB-dependent receptor [Beijerinckia indica]
MPALIVTADRVEEPISRTASSITIIPSEEIEKRGTFGLPNVLRGVPGLDLYETGGPGTATSVFLRGSAPGQTLVLIDGMRIGDPSSIDGSVDLGGLVATDLDQIEVLRGPQSALYGSAAMGGVINIVTRKGSGAPRASVLMEGGRYGTAHTRAALSGGTDRLSYAFSIDGLYTSAFPRYGYRITRPLTIGDGVTPLPPAPSSDPTRKGGFHGRLAYNFTNDISIEGGVIGYDSSIRFDNPYAYNTADIFNPYNHQHATFLQGYLLGKADLFDHFLHNRLSLFGNITDHSVWQAQSCYDTAYNAFDCRMGFRGARRGGEYQGDAVLGSLGLFTFGVRLEKEVADTSQDPAPPGAFDPIHASQTTYSGFAQHQLTLFDRFDITYGGRMDAIDKGPTFTTWRATGAYRIEETGTKLRASAGTGARIGSLYQRFSQYGNPALAPEYSIGYDAGIEQTLFGGHVSFSANYFENRFRNLIDFGMSASCFAIQVSGCYNNIGRAETKGVEFASEAVLIPDEWRLRASYTHLVATNLDTQQRVPRRPRDKGMLSIIYSAIPDFEFEARGLFVSATPDYDYTYGHAVMLPAYARIDLFASYKLNETVTCFARIENVNDARYEEVYNYGTPGRSLYGGLRVTW